MTAAPTISIVIPCYNQSQYLEECLASIISQTYQNWEAIVVDDASTQGDPCDIAQNFRDHRVTCQRHEQNRGLAAARNTGIQNSSGGLVLPVDADDKLAPTYLEKVSALLVNDHEYIAAYPDFYAFDAREGPIQLPVRDVAALLVNQWIPGPGTLFRRSVWEQAGGYCDELRAGNEDWDFWLSAAEHGLKVGHLPEPLYYYRQHANSMSIRLRYVEYDTREFMYNRHHLLFDHYGAGAAFRAGGYHRSAAAAWYRGEYLRAARLALRGAQLTPIESARLTLKVIRKALLRR